VGRQPLALALRIAAIRAVYRTAFLLPLRDRVALIAPQATRLTGNLEAIRAEIARRPRRPRVVVISAPVRQASRVARLLDQALHDLRAAAYLATSRLVVLDDYLFALYVVPRRPGTTVVQTWHAAGAFKRMGRSLRDRSFGGGRELLEHVAIHSNYDIVLVSSRSIAPHYAEAFAQPLERFDASIGLPRTDVLFGDAAVAAAEAVRMRYGIPRDRRVLLYAPTFRGDSALDARSVDALDLGALHDALAADHVLLLRLHPLVRDRTAVDAVHGGFVIDVSDHPSMNELLLVSDVLVTDYSSVFYEFALLGRPIVFFAPDLDAYERERGFYFDFRAGVPGPVVTSTRELVALLRHGDLHAYREQVAAAARAAFDVADGRASQRFVDRFVEPLVGGRASSEGLPGRDARD
jgi:CDP-ribitol ribitolphosphotransferase